MVSISQTNSNKDFFWQVGLSSAGGLVGIGGLILALMNGGSNFKKWAGWALGIVGAGTLIGGLGYSSNSETSSTPGSSYSRTDTPVTLPPTQITHPDVLKFIESNSSTAVDRQKKETEELIVSMKDTKLAPFPRVCAAQALIKNGNDSEVISCLTDKNIDEEFYKQFIAAHPVNETTINFFLQISQSKNTNVQRLTKEKLLTHLDLVEPKAFDTDDKNHLQPLRIIAQSQKNHILISKLLDPIPTQKTSVFRGYAAKGLASLSSAKRTEIDQKQTKAEKGRTQNPQLRNNILKVLIEADQIDFNLAEKCKKDKDPNIRKLIGHYLQNPSSNYHIDCLKHGDSDLTLETVSILIKNITPSNADKTGKALVDSLISLGTARTDIIHGLLSSLNDITFSTKQPEYEEVFRFLITKIKENPIVDRSLYNEGIISVASEAEKTLKEKLEFAPMQTVIENAGPPQINIPRGLKSNQLEAYVKATQIDPKAAMPKHYQPRKSKKMV